MCEDTICGKVLAQTVLCLCVSAYQIVELSGIGFKEVLVLMHWTQYKKEFRQKVIKTQIQSDKKCRFYKNYSKLVKISY